MQKNNLSSSAVLWTVFLFSIAIVLTSFVSVVFPAFILASDTVKIPGVEPITPDPFEPSAWAGSIIISSATTLGLAYLYLKKRLPRILSSAFERIFSFEISKKVALISVVLILLVYVSASIPELSTEEPWEDYIGVKDRLDVWSVDQIASSFEPHVRYLLIYASMALFGSYKIIPFLASIALLIMTYLITKTITGKRFAGVISLIILMQSNVFLTYDTSVAYTNFWILFYLVSLYMIMSRFWWPLSPVSFLLSIPSKALTVAFLPMSVYFILKSNISKRRKAITAGATVMIVVIGAAIIITAGAADTTADGAISSGGTLQEELDVKEFWMGFSSFAYQLRFDGLVLMFMIPLIVGLFLVSRHGVRHGESMMVLIAGVLLITPILTGFTNQTSQPYRFVPLIVFFAMGVGVLFSKRQV